MGSDEFPFRRASDRLFDLRHDEEGGAAFILPAISSEKPLVTTSNFSQGRVVCNRSEAAKELFTGCFAVTFGSGKGTAANSGSYSQEDD